MRAGERACVRECVHVLEASYLCPIPGFSAGPAQARGERSRGDHSQGRMLPIRAYNYWFYDSLEAIGAKGAKGAGP